MAPKRRTRLQVVASVVRTKVVRETVQLAAAGLELDLEPELETPAVDHVSGGSTVPPVQVEVGGSDATKTTAQQEQERPHSEETAPGVVPRSQETQDPKEEEDKAAAAAALKNEEGKKKRKAVRGRRRRRRGGRSGEDNGYKLYVWRVLKQVHPDMGASGRAMEVLDMMMADMFERLAEEAARLSKLSGRVTLTSREVQSAVRLVLPGDLAKHAISEGTKAISNYLSA